MDFDELFQPSQCIVCREAKPNLEESKCCHKHYCQECIKRIPDPDVCTICRQKTDFSDFSDFSDYALAFNLKFCDYSGNTLRNNLPQRVQPIINTASNYYHPDTNDTDLPNAFKITILNLEDRRINIVVEKSDTIKILKLKFQQKDGTAPEHQRLIFQGKQLEDHQTISYYKIEKDSVIHFVKCYNGS